MDGAPCMIGSIKGFVSLVQRENPNVVQTHCFLHRKVLVLKTIWYIWYIKTYGMNK